MVNFFVLSLFITLALARTISYLLHDKQRYGTPHERSKTLTGWLRKKTGFDWHHYHFGFLIVFISLLLSYFLGFNNLLIILLGIGASLFLDQISFLIFLDKNYFKEGYFTPKSLVISIIFHFGISFLFSSVNFG